MFVKTTLRNWGEPMSANVSSLGRNSEWTKMVGAPNLKSIIRDE